MLSLAAPFIVIFFFGAMQLSDFQNLDLVSNLNFCNQ